MNERQEQTADVLGKLTVLGTIVLPMNIITGMWGMNVLVPGQDSDTLTWFWSSESACKLVLWPQGNLGPCVVDYILTCPLPHSYPLPMLLRSLLLLHRKTSLWHCLIWEWPSVILQTVVEIGISHPFNVYIFLESTWSQPGVYLKSLTSCAKGRRWCGYM